MNEKKTRGLKYFSFIVETRKYESFTYGELCSLEDALVSEVRFTQERIWGLEVQSDNVDEDSVVDEISDLRSDIYTLMVYAEVIEAARERAFKESRR